MKAKLPPIINHCYLLTTNACNLRCSYCYCKDRDKNDEFPYEWIDKVKNMFSCSSKPKVILFGGEPLLRVNLIKRIVENYKNDFQFQVVTNGTINFHKFMEEIYEPNRTNFDVQISWDGDVNTRILANGNSTYVNVYETILEELEKGRILVGRAVLNEESVKRFYKTYLTYKELNRKYKFGADFTIAHQKSFKDSYSIDLREQLKLVYNDVKEQLNTDEKFYCPNLLLKTITNILQNKRDVVSCDIGTHVAIKPNGDVYPCVILAQQDERFKMGNINTEIDTEIITKLRYDSHCPKECAFKNICDGGCRYERIINYPNSWACEVCSHTCDIYKVIFEETQLFLDNLTDNERNRLITYLDEYNMFMIDYDNGFNVDNQKPLFGK